MPLLPLITWRWPRRLKAALQIPEEEHPQLILALGYPDETAEDKLQLHDKRKDLSELTAD